MHASATVELVRTDGGRAAPGEVGEVRVRGACVVGGYYEQPEETARYFRDGWYYPGDLASMDADGMLRVLGRTDDLMNIGALKFRPAEIETLVRRPAQHGGVLGQAPRLLTIRCLFRAATSWGKQGRVATTVLSFRDPDPHRPRRRRLAWPIRIAAHRLGAGGVGQNALLGAAPPPRPIGAGQTTQTPAD